MPWTVTVSILSMTLPRLQMLPLPRTVAVFFAVQRLDLNAIKSLLNVCARATCIMAVKSGKLLFKLAPTMQDNRV